VRECEVLTDSARLFLFVEEESGLVLFWGAQSKNKGFTEMCSGSEEGSHLRLIDFCITQL